MNRRSSAPLTSRTTGPARGGGLRGGLPLLIAGGIGALLLIVVVIVVAKSCSGGKSAAPTGNQARAVPGPRAPAGYTYASKYYLNPRDLIGKKVNPFVVPLTGSPPPRGLAFFAYDGANWNRLVAALVSADGKTAQPASEVDLPKNFAVLRSSGSDLQVFGAVPSGSGPSSEAAQTISALVPAAYAPAADGGLTGNPVTSPPNAGYGTIPAIRAESGDAAQAITTILMDQTRSATHADRIAAEVEKGNYAGIEIDYTTVEPAVKKNFTSFVQALGGKLHANKRRLVLRIPLPRRDGDNWNTFGYDWPELGKVADSIILAVDRDQSTYRSRVPKAVEFLTQQVPAGKLALEVTPLSADKSDQQPEPSSITTLQALSLASQITVRDGAQVSVNADVTASADNVNRENSAGLQWTPQGVLSFAYKLNDQQHTVWVEDAYSVAFKLEIAQLYKLGGVAVENAAGDATLADIWPAIDRFLSPNPSPPLQPNPQALRPQWLADDKPLPDAPRSAVVTWRAPAQPGQHTLGIILGDGLMSVKSTTPVTVRAAAPGSTSTPGAGVTPSVRSTPTPARTPSPTRTATSTGR